MDISPANWSVLSRLLDEAFDLDLAERGAWLTRQEVERPELAATLRKLLALHASSETADVLPHLGRLSAAPDVPATAGLEVGGFVGPYRIKRSLGSGGMADVWLVERMDGVFERELALKVPRLTRLRPDLEERFARERNILARLEHPHIARMYDAGVADTLPYMAMEFVDGQPVATYCDAQCLNIEGRLRLFAQVLDAVQYAHANLVIHRDLKPSNILVTASGRVQLLDFGIAKLLADVDEAARETQLTQISGRALTLDYASPEQIKGEALTIATDVYSLGVVLYELLAGERPYRLRLHSLAQLEQAILSVDPSRLSSAVRDQSAQARGTNAKRLTRTLAGDLDTIVLKALAKSPAQRYATVAEFAEDLRRWLSGEAVRARPASWWYRMSKFVQRNRLAVGAGTTVVSVLIAATTISLWQARLARQQADRAEQVKEFVLSFFGGAADDKGGSRQTTALEMLAQARALLETSSIKDAATRVELLTTVGSALVGLDEVDQALSILADAVQLGRDEFGALHRLTAIAQFVYGQALGVKKDWKAAEVQLDAAADAMRHLGENSLLAANLRVKAQLLYNAGQFDAGIELAREAVAIAERQREAQGKRALLAACETLASLLQASHRAGALEPSRRAFALAKELYGDRPTSLALSARLTYARALADEGDGATALIEMKAVVRQQAILFGAESNPVVYSLRRIARLALELGDPVEAIDSFREALRITVARSGAKGNADIAVSHIILGSALANAHRYEAALAQFNEAAHVFASMGSSAHPFVGVARSGMGLALTKLGQLSEADSIFAERRKIPFPDRTTEVLANEDIAQLRSAQGRHDEALHLLREAVAFWTRTSDRLYALALDELGLALVAAGQHDEAIDVLHQARALLRKAQSNGSPDLADIAVGLARAHVALGHSEQAVAAAEEATAFWLRFDPANRDAGIAHLWHARALAATGDAVRAAETARRAAAVLAEKGRPDDRVLLAQVQREIASRAP
jgi:serine/threonine-protein kinase